MPITLTVLAVDVTWKINAKCIDRIHLPSQTVIHHNSYMYITPNSLNATDTEMTHAPKLHSRIPARISKLFTSPRKQLLRQFGDRGTPR